MTERTLSADPDTTPKSATKAATRRRRGVSRREIALEREREEIALGPKGPRPRRRRGSLNAHQMRLTIHNKNPDYEYHWFVDRDNRIKDAFDNDWDFVVATDHGEHAISDDPGTKLSQVANKVSGGQRLYAMAKPKVYYDEDQKEKQARLDAVDEAIFRNKRAEGAAENQMLPTAQEDVAGQFYLPTSSPRHMVKGE